MPAEFGPQISRRNLIRKGAALGLGIALAAVTDKLILSQFVTTNITADEIKITLGKSAPENTQQIPEVVIPPNEIVSIKNVESKFTGKIGIEEMRVIHDSKSKLTFVFTKPNQNSAFLTARDLYYLGLDKASAGFIPYEPNFDPANAASTLKQTKKDNDIEFPLTDESLMNMMEVSKYVWGSSNIGGTTFVYSSTPQLDTDQMYVFDKNFTRPRNSIDPKDFSTAGILKIKFRFIDSPATPLRQRPQRA